jgi:hypothetical protein
LGRFWFNVFIWYRINDSTKIKAAGSAMTMASVKKGKKRVNNSLVSGKAKEEKSALGKAL